MLTLLEGSPDVCPRIVSYSSPVSVLRADLTEDSIVGPAAGKSLNASFEAKRSEYSETNYDCTRCVPVRTKSCNNTQSLECHVMTLCACREQ